MIAITKQNADVEALTGHTLHAFKSGKTFVTQGCRCLDLNGKTVAHGMIDDHIHIHLILEDRDGLGATLITSQVPTTHWHEAIGDPTLADAILGRLIKLRH